MKEYRRGAGLSAGKICSSWRAPIRIRSRAILVETIYFDCAYSMFQAICRGEKARQADGPAALIGAGSRFLPSLRRAVLSRQVPGCGEQFHSSTGALLDDRP